ncbi:formate/nitrite transporter family protein [Pseudooceanicola marinus]|uniref:formate/nitrite transporter family protein n=1 Tax=Pseudooceanicola marinus TaxID=396013 RepID=UPI001C93D50E|nr:formate/nitrite transporter family protein [Pseudooceanicola marinus]MBY5971786.1 formate/nitrite transporter family protein [Ferrimonas balearica]MCA1336162.1 formate/nitrite transporter family protein [Pseudooceanicola marinus]
MTDLSDPKHPHHDATEQTSQKDHEPDLEDLEEKLPSTAAAVHEIIRREGDKEMARDGRALLWSAIAGGITMATSYMARGLLHAHLPDTDIAFLVESMGYTLGFIFVICAGQQLFTENTVTPVLPVMSDPTKRNVARVLRLWAIVLAGNTAGGAIAGAVLAFMPLFDSDTTSAFVEIGRHLIGKPAPEMFSGGVISGWLIATLVWAMAAAPRARLWLIFLATWLVSVGDFPHVIAGTTEVLYLVFLGQASLGAAVLEFWLPTLLGNVIGGTFIFALIAHAQVRADVDDKVSPRNR